MPTPAYSNYISQITLPSGTTYYIKDSEARQWIEDIVSAGIEFVMAWSGLIAPDVTKIPAGVVVTYNDTEYTGTLAASASTQGKIYLVASDATHATARDVYEEYITVVLPTVTPVLYTWEALGNTDISLSGLGDLAWKDNVTLNKGSGDTVLGTGTTFTASSSDVSWTPYTDTLNKTYSASTSKLETTSVTGVAGEVTFNAVNANTSVTATNTVFGTDTTASKVTTESKTATNTVFGTATKASKATAGTAVSLAKPAASATNLSYVGNSSTSSVLETATVASGTETLVIGTVAVSQGTVTGINGSQSITPYTFTDVTVPVVSSNASVTVASVKTNTDIVVPVVSSNTEVTATNTTTVSKTAATKAANAITVATGSLNATDTAGATIATGINGGDPVTVMTGLTGVTAAAPTITVGTNDQVNVAKYGDLSITVS